MSAKSDFIKAMQDCQEGIFTPPVKGVTFGFSMQDGKCTVFDTVEDDDYREETFDSVESALDGFMVDGKSLASYVGKLAVEPIRNL